MVIDFLAIMLFVTVLTGFLLIHSFFITWNKASL
jgi:hypothetical protein